MRNADLEDREAVAAVAGLFFLIGVPAIVLGFLVFMAGWWWILGIPGGHGLWLGWASNKFVDSHGHTHFTIGRAIPAYCFGVISTYLIYQLCELLYGGFKLFQGALVSD